MQQNATQKRQRLDLNDSQVNALAALVAGKNVTQAAEIAEVDRTTVHRWLREDWDFQAALNQERRDLMKAVEGKLPELRRTQLTRSQVPLNPATHAPSYLC